MGRRDGGGVLVLVSVYYLVLFPKMASASLNLVMLCVLNFTNITLGTVPTWDLIHSFSCFPFFVSVLMSHKDGWMEWGFMPNFNICHIVADSFSGGGKT